MVAPVDNKTMKVVQKEAKVPILDPEADDGGTGKWEEEQCYLRQFWWRLCQFYNSHNAGCPRWCFAVAVCLCGLLYLGWPISMAAVAMCLPWECPIQPELNASLGVTACIWLLGTFCICLLAGRRPSRPDQQVAMIKSPLCPIIAQWIVLLGFFIWGAMLVYPVYGRVQHVAANETTYCHPVLYYYALASTTSMLAPSAVALVILAVLGLCCLRVKGS